MDRFWQKVNKTSGAYGTDGTFPTECWEWTASLWGKGYGQFRLEGKSVPAHRMSWTLTNGSISNDQFVLHKCDNRKCVRPDHLFIGSAKDNTRDMCQKGRARGGVIGERNGSAKLRESDIKAIRLEHRLGTTYKVLSIWCGVSISALKKIVNRHTWKHVV